MSTTTNGSGGSHQRSDHPIYVEIQESPEFGELRSRFRKFVFPATVAFMTWYLLYVVMSNWATDFMSTKIVGQHQRRPGLRPSPVRLDLPDRLALRALHE